MEDIDADPGCTGRLAQRDVPAAGGPAGAPTVLDAKFSLPFLVASAAVRREIRVADLTEKALAIHGCSPQPRRSSPSPTTPWTGSWRSRPGGSRSSRATAGRYEADRHQRPRHRAEPHDWERPRTQVRRLRVPPPRCPCPPTRSSRRSSWLEDLESLDDATAPPRPSMTASAQQPPHRPARLRQGRRRSVDLGIAGRTALVTASSGGMGLSIAHAMAAEGADLVLFARSADKLKAAAAEVAQKHGVTAHAEPGSMVDAADVQRLADRLRTGVALTSSFSSPVDRRPRFAPPSRRPSTIAVGGGLRQPASRASCDVVNGVVPLMADRGWGRIIAVTSAHAKQPMVGHALSTVFRAGVTAYMKGLAVEIADQGITVNCVAPALIETVHRTGQAAYTAAQAEHRRDPDPPGPDGHPGGAECGRRLPGLPPGGLRHRLHRCGGGRHGRLAVLAPLYRAKLKAEFWPQLSRSVHVKIWFQLMASEQRSPGFISAVQHQLRQCVSPSTEVLVRGTTHGAFADQYRLLFHYDEREIITNGLQAQRDGFDVFALGNSLDPGVVALREVLDIPVVVQMEVSCSVAMMTGEKFGVVATNTKSEPRYREIVHGYGLTSRLAGVDSVRFDHLPRIHEAFTDPEIAAASRRRLQGRHATPGRRGADTVIGGGVHTTMLPNTVCAKSTA